MTAPYCDKINLEKGTRKNLFLMHVTRGQQGDSFVYHRKEDRKYFQYHKLQINKNTINLKIEPLKMQLYN
jgi:hypothetical protein